MNKQQKIKELEKRIKELQKVYKSDVRESYREAQQTQEIIQHLTKQVEMLKAKNSEGSQIQTFTLKSNDGTRIIKIGEKVDPEKGIISADSPIGKQLLQSESGNSIQIGTTNWIIT